MKKFEIFVVTAPGLEKPLAAEIADAGFKKPKMMPGGVRFRGNWQDVWRANLCLRGAVRVLARIDNFQAMHLNQLERLIADMPWRQYLRTDVPLKVDVATQKSKIYHAGAAKERIERGLATAVGAPISAEADVVVKARIDNNMVTLSLDTTGESLHKRGHKAAVAKAPMRENMAAMFLRQLGFDGSQPVYDPMCGSGTFVIEAAEIAAGLLPGRSRSFAFEQLATFDAEAFAALRVSESHAPSARFMGSDKDAGAIRMAGENASRAGVADWASFAQKSAGEITAPDGPPGIVVVNPPYGARIGDKKGLFALYASFGKALTQHFSGWTVGIVTTDTGLARATGLPLETPFATVVHGGLKVQLYTCEVP
ncbi:THUMP domain-containing class I SAM-dependent RNA methyltransferase [Shimia sp. MMG029]|uniref:THUMP domain-containing class I SAM-dependent RNA methyltransferase n=1 Tax=Shimia sp. MMG029 TaxID=3021978 RepID=UPI0022FF07F5|nr:class I SAM-dependent RNA methyltransferase [Shimia sp. MMG029]MDA5556544.1 class I SAM-dependent RNA methyltransferase [Shimia sp. MMG029]